MRFFEKFGQRRATGKRQALTRGAFAVAVLGSTAVGFTMIAASPASPETKSGVAATAPAAGDSGNSGNTGTSAGGATTTPTTTATTAPTSDSSTTNTTTAPPSAPVAQPNVVTHSPSIDNGGTITWTGNGTNPDGSCASFQDDLGPVPSGDMAWLFILTSPDTGPFTLTTVFSPAGGTTTSGTQKGNGAVHFIVLSPIGATLQSASAVTGTSNSVLTVSHCQNGSGIASQISTTVFDGTTNEPWSGTETVGATAYDTATAGPKLVAGPSAVPELPTMTGTVTYTFFTNGSCDGDGTDQTVTLAGDGSIPNSPTTLSLAAGSYSYLATYGGDSNYDSAVGDCEPFSVAQVPVTTSTILNDAATNSPWSGNETTGAQAYDTSTVNGTIDGFTPTGQVTYTLFDNGTCTGPAEATNAHAIISSQTVDLNGDGTVPNSDTTSPLTPGNYSFDASYSGDNNYSASGVSECEPFSVNDAPTTTSTVLKDAATGQNWAGTEVAPASAFDTATVSGAAGGIVPTGTVTYSFFTNGTCNGTPASTDPVTLNADGSVPNSSTTAALAAGSYSFDAIYGGDPNYVASAVSACEPFTIAPVTSPASTAGAAVTPTTPTTTPPKTAGASAIAFTGADLEAMTGAAIALLGLGGGLVLLGRRRRGQASAARVRAE